MLVITNSVGRYFRKTFLLLNTYITKKLRMHEIKFYEIKETEKYLYNNTLNVCYETYILH